MALVDAFDILSDKQVISGNCYSDRAKDLQTESDWGQSAVQRYVKFIVEGTHSKALTIQLLGANREDFSDNFVIAQTTAIPAADLVAGHYFFLPVPAVGKKYRYFAIKYLPTGGADDEEEKTDTGSCPTSPVLGETAEVANGITAFFTLVDDYKTVYPYVNADKATV